MTTDEKLDFLLYEMQSMKSDMQGMKVNMQRMEANIATKDDIANMAT